MIKEIEHKQRYLPKLLLSTLVFFTMYTLLAQRLPYTIENNSEFADNEVFVAVVGEELPGGKFIWVDPVNGQINRMSRSDNTVPGPVIGGNQGPGLDGRYANCFRRLTEIPNNTINIPQIAGCRIFISFKSQLYLYFFGYDGDPRGYAGANLANPTDPNQGITFEVVELTYNEFGIFNNTSRVDAFQYPIGLEVEGENFFKKVGELKTQNEIFDRWEQQVPAPFKQLLDREKKIISFPTKDESFPKDYLDGYINAIWNKYRSQELYFNSGEAGRWRGSVQSNDHFVFRRESDGQIASIFGKPSTLEAMEGSGVMAQGDRWDLVVQAQFVAAITRHSIDLNTASGAFQDFGDTTKYYQVEPYNWYAKFLHQTDISFEGQTYAFAYDDVFDQSATIASPNPFRAKITLGPIQGTSNPPTGPVVTWTSSNIDAHIIRHQNGRGRIDANVQSEDDGKWRMVPGLAGRGVSFQSVNFPNRYLRHRNNQVWLDPFMDSNLYKADATFIQRPGLSNDSQVSFEASNFPGRYLRHRGSLLYVESISSNLDRQDATFTNGDSNPAFTERIEAEDYVAMSGIQLEPCSEGGQNVGYIDAGDWMAYREINFPLAGLYKLEFRVASATGGGRLSIDLNSGETILGEVNVPNTGGWQNWTTVSQEVNIPSGNVPFGIFAQSGGWNINWIKIQYLGNSRSADRDQGNDIFSYSVYPNPATDQLTLKGISKDSKISMMSLSGQQIEIAGKRASESEYVLDINQLPVGIYFLKVNQDTSTKVMRFVKK